VSAVVVGLVLPLFQFVGEQARVVDDLAVEEPVELFGVDPVGSFYSAVQPGVRGLMRTWSMPLSSRCQWNEAPNSDCESGSTGFATRRLRLVPAART
jgi:hypothetical protein